MSTAVESMRSVALEIPKQAKVAAALAACELVPAGIVITDHAQAVALTDAARTIIEGEKAIAAAVADALRIPRQIEAAVRDAVREPLARLAAAKATANLARVAWQAELDRQAAAEEAAARVAAREASEVAAAEAILEGKAEPPPMEPAPVVAPRAVVGGAGVSGTQVRVEAVDVVKWGECPQEWLVLNRSLAEASFRAAEKAGSVKRAAPGESVEWRGVSFVSVRRAVNR